MGKVLITGATGLVGTALCKMLSDKGFELIILSRSKSDGAKYVVFDWNLQKKYINEAVFEQKIDYVIHLAGSPIADKPWTLERKQEIIESRVESIKLLAHYLEKTGTKPKAFISAAAIGIYGNNGVDDTFLTEDSPIKTNSDEFLVQSCTQWEAAIAHIERLGIRTAILRIGIVLSTQGGALAKMLPSYRFGVGAYFGNGNQYYSWVHIDDICRMFLFLVENESATGVFNGVAPQPVRNKELAAAIAKARGKKALLMPVPAMAMRLAMGEMSAIVLDGARVQPARFLSAGFEFRFPEVVEAIKDLIMRKV